MPPLLTLLARGCSNGLCLLSGVERGVNSRYGIGAMSATVAALVPIPSTIAFSRSSLYGPVLLRDRPLVATEFARLRTPTEERGERLTGGKGSISLFSLERIFWIGSLASGSLCCKIRGSILGTGGVEPGSSRGGLSSVSWPYDGRRELEVLLLEFALAMVEPSILRAFGGAFGGG